MFCRLEHVVPWAFQGAHWTAAPVEEPPSLETCAHCGDALTDVQVTLIRHRGEHRIADGFCSVDHAAAWARAGGRWR